MVAPTPIRVVNFDTGMPTTFLGSAPTPFDFGAAGDGTTDDSTAIQNAINSLSNGGLLYFPPATYAIGTATTITLPTAKAITLLGSGRGDTAKAGTVLKATAALTGGVINSGTAFIRGHRISNMTISGNAQAAYCLKMDAVSNASFDNLSLYDATTINFRLGDGTHQTQENTVFMVRLDNPLTTVLANLPTYNFELNGTNNNVLNVKAANAKTANIHSSSTSSNNTYQAVHGYDFFSGAAQAPTNNILIDGTGEQFVGWEGDGSSSANVQINGFANILAMGVSQFASPLSAQIGIQFANATSGNIAFGNVFSNSTTANMVVQAGTAAAPGNFFWGNYNGTQGTTTASRIVTPVVVASLPSAVTALQGAYYYVSDSSVTTFHATVAAGGGNLISVWCDGTQWRVGG